MIIKCQWSDLYKLHSWPDYEMILWWKKWRLYYIWRLNNYIFMTSVFLFEWRESWDNTSLTEEFIKACVTLFCCCGGNTFLTRKNVSCLEMDGGRHHLPNSQVRPVSTEYHDEELMKILSKLSFSAGWTTVTASSQVWAKNTKPQNQSACPECCCQSPQWHQESGAH